MLKILYQSKSKRCPIKYIQSIQTNVKNYASFRRKDFETHICSQFIHILQKNQEMTTLVYIQMVSKTRVYASQYTFMGNIVATCEHVK